MMNASFKKIFRLRKALYHFSALASMLAACSNLFAASVSVNPIADAFVTTGTGNSLVASNYGSAGALAVSASGLSKGEFQSFLKFDLSSVKSTLDADYGAGLWTIQSITLSLVTTAPNNGIFNNNAAGQFNLSWTQDTSWTEGTGTPNAPASTGITFSTAPSFQGPNDQLLGTFSFAGGTTGNNSYTLALTSGLVNGARNGSVVGMDMVAADSAVSYLVDSGNFTQAGSRPLLTITAIPEPGTLTLGGLGAALLLALRRFVRNNG